MELWIDGGAYAPAKSEPKAVDKLGLRLELLDEFGGSTTAETSVEPKVVD